MADQRNGGIGWTDETWNPLRGCSRVSEGCRNCLAPETPILYSDFVWRPIGEARPGDRLLAFDEQAQPGHPRKFREAVVEAVWASRQPTKRLITEEADLVTTAEHRWLRHRSVSWPTTDRLVVGKPLRQIGVTAAPAVTEDYRIGYLAGLTLGDGTFRFQPGQRSDKLGFPQAYWRVALAVRDEAALGRVVSYLASVGIEANIRPFSSATDRRQAMLKVEVRALGSLARLSPILASDRETAEFCRGWLAGFFDAEGSGRESLRFSQVDRAVLGRVQRCALRLGFHVDIEGDQSPRASNARLVGSALERLRFLTILNPALTRKAGLLGIRQQQRPDRVERVESGPVADVVDIQTSARTFFAAGLATHNCYAEIVAGRFSGPGQAYEGLAKRIPAGARWTGEIQLVEAHLADPLGWKRPRRIFVNSMSDLFHEKVEDSWLRAIFGVMWASGRHTFQVLTKRPERMRVFMATFITQSDRASWLIDAMVKHGLGEYRIGRTAGGSQSEPLRNVHLGVSCEDQATADERIPLLLQTPAAVRWVSYEPALAAVDFTKWLPPFWSPPGEVRKLGEERAVEEFDDGTVLVQMPDLGIARRPALNWCVIGGESGPGARPFDLSWARRTITQCRAAGVRAFFKQAGSRPVLDGTSLRLRDRKGGDLSELPAEFHVREYPRA